LELAFDAAAGALSVLYDKHRFPVDPREYTRVLAAAGERLETTLGADHPDCREFRGAVDALSRLPPRDELSPERRAERARDTDCCQRALAALCARSPEVARHVSESVRAINGRPGEPASFDRLHEFIEAQAYRLTPWRVASADINSRRFFDINDLAALRMESPDVFEDTHRLVFKLLAEGKISALRIDHPDGLYDPPQYFERLQNRARAEIPCSNGDTLPSVPRCIYIALEKVLAEHERLPEHWTVHGTTGYRYLNVVNGLFVDHRAEMRMDRTYAAFIGGHINYEELLQRTKIMIMTTAL